ncbi:MAG: hypothetical protein HFI81_12360 [Eubacterium sp.]|nr:hypothetical protein [Eubacterium sp.]
MNPYEEILKVMRNEGRKDNNAPIQIGVMDGEDSLRMGKLKLSGKDFLMAEHLKGKLKKGDMVAVYRHSEERYLVLAKVVEA